MYSLSRTTDCPQLTESERLILPVPVQSVRIERTMQLSPFGRGPGHQACLVHAMIAKRSAPLGIEDADRKTHSGANQPTSSGATYTAKPKKLEIFDFKMMCGPIRGSGPRCFLKSPGRLRSVKFIKV